jgi:hypothetical protein
MARVFELTADPVLIDLGRTARPLVRASVPFVLDDVLYCAAFPHVIDPRVHKRSAVVYARGSEPAGQMTVWGSH